MANLLCPVCGKPFYGISIGKPCPHIRLKSDGLYEFIQTTTSDAGEQG